MKYFGGYTKQMIKAASVNNTELTTIRATEEFRGNLRPAAKHDKHSTRLWIKK